MKYIVYFSSENQFSLTKEELEFFIKEIKDGAKIVHIQRLNAFLTDKFIFAGQKPSDPNVGYLHDGTKIIKQFGQWKDARNPSVKLDPHYYPEAYNDNVMSEEEFKNKQLEYEESKRLT